MVSDAPDGAEPRTRGRKLQTHRAELVGQRIEGLSARDARRCDRRPRVSADSEATAERASALRGEGAPHVPTGVQAGRCEVKVPSGTANRRRSPAQPRPRERRSVPVRRIVGGGGTVRFSKPDPSSVGRSPSGVSRGKGAVGGTDAEDLIPSWYGCGVMRGERPAAGDQPEHQLPPHLWLHGAKCACRGEDAHQGPTGVQAGCSRRRRSSRSHRRAGRISMRG